MGGKQSKERERETTTTTTTSVGGGGSSSSAAVVAAGKEAEKSNNEDLASSSATMASNASTTGAADASSSGGQEEGGGCPMKMEGGGYRMAPGFGSLFGRRKGHPPVAPASSSPPPSSDGDEGGSGGGGCPVKGGGGGWPSSSSAGQRQYNVYSQPIDPTNMMPASAAINQLPAPQQTEALPTARIPSTIPKGGADHGTTWTYPSPQMFYNALARKGKLGDTVESDIESVVAMHNNMNEKTWAKVMEWEDVLRGQSPSDGEAKGHGSKLSRFLGRPSDLSPKAAFKHYVLGHPLPFDRHDWTIVRPDGSEVRYVIDYYHDEALARTDPDSAMPDMHDREAIQSILVDVRPALDGPTSMIDRAIVMPLVRRGWYPGRPDRTPFEPLPMLPTDSLRSQVGESQKLWDNIQAQVKKSKEEACSSDDVDKGPKQIVVPRDDDGEPPVTDEEATALAKSFASVLKECQDAKEAVDACQSEQDCAKASLGLTMCMAKLVCPVQHAAVQESLRDDGNVDPNDGKARKAYDDKVDAALANAMACVAGVDAKVAKAKQSHPEKFERL